MGGRNLPGSTGRLDGGEPAAAQGIEALDQYGRGEKDPDTGLWEWYEDVPQELGARATGFSLLALCERWDLLVADFASEYGIRVATAGLSWREFRSYLTGLLACDSRLRRHFAPEDYEPEKGAPGG